MMADKAREVAWHLEQDGETPESVSRILAGMADRVGHEPENDVLMDNFMTLTEAKKELEYMQGTAAEYERQQQQQQQQQAAPQAYGVVYAIHGERRGVARTQRIVSLSERAEHVICHDLEGEGFDHVIDIAEAGTQSGLAHVYYRPDPEAYVPRAEHAKELDMMFEAFFKTDERGE